MRGLLRVVRLLETFAVPVIALAFTAFYAHQQQQRVLDQMRIALIPLLAHEHAETRFLALTLTPQLAPEFAPIASAVLIGDQDPRTRETALRTLKQAAETAHSAVQREARQEISQLAVRDVLRASGLVGVLEQAAQATELDPARAAETYRRVLQELPALTRAKLDQGLLADAEADARAGNFDLAARRYAAVFAPHR